MKRKVIWHLILAAYVMFIFSNSLTPAVQSSAESGFVLRLVHQAINSVGLTAAWLTEHIIRKCAHFGEYTILGILLFQSMKQLSCNEALRRQIHTLLVFFIPFVDETFQLFTEGRSGQISDVWLDMSGALAGTIIYICIYFLVSGKTEKRSRGRWGNRKKWKKRT